MKHWAQNRFNALLSACVMSLIATAGWSQSLTWLGGCRAAGSEAYAVSADGSVVVGWAYNAAGQPRAFRWTASGGMQDLGTLGGDWSYANGVSADGAVVVGWASTPQGRGVPFAGRRRVGCKTSARWAAIRARLWVFPPTAPWWSAWLTTPQGVSCLSLDGVGHARPRHAGRQLELRLMVFPPTAPWWSARLKRRRGLSCLSLDGVGWDARPRHAAGRRLERGFWCFRRRRRGGRLGLQRRRAAACLSLDGVGWDARPRHAGRRLERCWVFPPTAPWWSATLTTPQGRGVPFAGRRRAAWKT
jgi:probable HAF family extracellular repeat protein